MKKVVTFGVFDYFHYGHLKLFERAKALGDYLIVAVQDGDYILKFKPDAKVMYPTEQRVEMIAQCRVVDEVQIYTSVFDDIQKIDFDIFAIGGDQNHQGFKDAVAWCEENGKQVIRLERTKGVCSSDIKQNIKK